MLVACILIKNLPYRVEVSSRPALRRKPAIIYEDAMPPYRVVDATPRRRIHAGMPLAAALERCPDATLVAADSALYRRQWRAAVSRLHDVCGDASDAGAGCAYAVVADPTGRFDGNEARIVAALMRAVPPDWQPAVGVAAGRFPARCAADNARPGHAVRVPDAADQLGAFMAPVSVNRLPMDVRQLAALHDAGIHTLGQVAAASVDTLQDAVGNDWQLAWELSRGIDRRSLTPTGWAIPRRIDSSEVIRRSVRYGGRQVAA